MSHGARNCPFFTLTARARLRRRHQEVGLPAAGTPGSAARPPASATSRALRRARARRSAPAASRLFRGDRRRSRRAVSNPRPLLPVRPARLALPNWCGSPCRTRSRSRARCRGDRLRSDRPCAMSSACARAIRACARTGDQGERQRHCRSATAPTLTAAVGGGLDLQRDPRRFAPGGVGGQRQRKADAVRSRFDKRKIAPPAGFRAPIRPVRQGVPRSRCHSEPRTHARLPHANSAGGDPQRPTSRGPAVGLHLARLLPEDSRAKPTAGSSTATFARAGVDHDAETARRRHAPASTPVNVGQELVDSRSEGLLRATMHHAEAIRCRAVLTWR